MNNPLRFAGETFYQITISYDPARPARSDRLVGRDQHRLDDSLRGLHAGGHGHAGPVFDYAVAVSAPPPTTTAIADARAVAACGRRWPAISGCAFPCLVAFAALACVAGHCRRADAARANETRRVRPPAGGVRGSRQAARHAGPQHAAATCRTSRRSKTTPAPRRSRPSSGLLDTIWPGPTVAREAQGVADRQPRRAGDARASKRRAGLSLLDRRVRRQDRRAGPPGAGGLAVWIAGAADHLSEEAAGAGQASCERCNMLQVAFEPPELRPRARQGRDVLRPSSTSSTRWSRCKLPLVVPPGGDGRQVGELRLGLVRRAEGPGPENRAEPGDGGHDRASDRGLRQGGRRPSSTSDLAKYQNPGWPKTRRATTTPPRSTSRTSSTAFEPFYRALVLYVVAFVLAALGWLGWTGPLNRAAFWLIVLALACTPSPWCRGSTSPAGRR